VDGPRIPERTAARFIVAAAVLVFVALLVVGGPFYQSFDEAKYLGLGENLFAGRGYTTVFGATFTTHSPAWPAILVAPQVWVGVDALSWGRVLNGLSGAGLVLACAALAWRIRPAAGALAAVAMVGVVYLHDLTRTARLDVPGAFLSVLAVLVGIEAMRRVSARRAVASGALFALAFLIKETSLVYVAVPTLSAIIWRQPLRTVARLTAWIVLVLALGVSWWFAFVAATTGLIYRTSLPARMLAPLALLLALAIAVGLAAEPIAESRPGTGLARALERLGRRWPAVAGAVPWLLPVAWVLLLLVVLARSPELGRAGLFDFSQWRAWVGRWLPSMRFALVFGLVGGVATLANAFADWRARRRGARPEAAQVTFPSELLVANLAGIPLLLFVIATGEPPRNDFAPLVFAISFAAPGWLLIAEWLVRNRGSAVAIAAAAIVGAMVGVSLSALFGRPSSRMSVVGGVLVGGAAFALTWLRPRLGDLVASRAARYALAGALVLSLIVTTGALAVHVRRHPGSAGDSARAEAVATVTGWIRANVPLGTPLAFGALLGNEFAIELEGYPVVKLSAIQASFDLTAPLALRGGTGTQDDWIAIDPHPRKETSFFVFGADGVTRALVSRHVAYWIYTTGESTAAPTILGALTPANGFEQVQHWQWRNGDETSVFRVDPARLRLAGQPVRIAPGALDRLVSLLEARGQAARVPARALLDRLEVWPQGSGAAPALATLKALAGSGG
jgi:hypothetical protein